MTNANSTASNAHKQAASDHEACAKHHSMAADCHDKNKLDEAKINSNSAMKSCESASKHSVTACGCSAK